MGVPGCLYGPFRREAIQADMLSCRSGSPETEIHSPSSSQQAGTGLKRYTWLQESRARPLRTGGKGGILRAFEERFGTGRRQSG